MKELIFFIAVLGGMTGFAQAQDCDQLISSAHLLESLQARYGDEVTQMGEEYVFESTGVICSITRARMENTFLFSSDPQPGQVGTAICSDPNGNKQILSIDFQQVNIGGLRPRVKCDYTVSEVIININN